MAYERLLEKKWGDIKHLETERHWFLGAFAVFVAGSLAFLSQLAAKNVSGISPSYVYVVLIFLSAIALVHALIIYRMLGRLQVDINEIVEEWRGGAESPADKRFMGRWSFVRGAGVAGFASLGALHVVLYFVAFVFFIFLFVVCLLGFNNCITNNIG